MRLLRKQAVGQYARRVVDAHQLRESRLHSAYQPAHVPLLGRVTLLNDHPRVTAAQPSPLRPRLPCKRAAARSERQAARPTLRYGEHPVKYNPTPKFLGVLFDETLSFAPHVQRTTAEVHRRSRVFVRLSGVRWGMDTKSLRTLYQSYVQSVLDYGLAGYPAPAGGRGRRGTSARPVPARPSAAA